MYLFCVSFFFKVLVFSFFVAWDFYFFNWYLQNLLWSFRFLCIYVKYINFYLILDQTIIKFIFFLKLNQTPLLTIKFLYKKNTIQTHVSPWTKWPLKMRCDFNKANITIISSFLYNKYINIFSQSGFTIRIIYISYIVW